MEHKKTLPILAAVCLFIAAQLSGCSRDSTIQKSGFYFDTIISVTLYDSTKTEELDHCFELADTYEKYFSTKLADSDISKINRAGTKSVHVHDETKELLELGLSYSALSQGKFDITIGNLTSLWDFHSKTPSLPNKKKIAKAVSSIHYQAVKISGNEVSLSDPDASIDLGGIAKGYIADKIKEYLVSCGVTSGIINLGGNVLTIGEKTDGSAYTIGIQRPFDETGAAIATLKIKDQTIVTSGTYERYFEQDGALYHHILDTSTGYPYDNGLCSVSIICGKSADGDGLSTTCFAMGLKKGMDFIESLDDTEAIFITSDQTLHCSSGIGTKIPFEEIK